MPNIDIPFLIGQDESWDKKVLPVGPMRAVRNMKLEHNAEMLRRNQAFGKISRSSDYTVVGYGQPNQFIQKRTDSSEGVGRIDGSAPSYSVVDGDGKLPFLGTSDLRGQGVGNSEAYGDQLSPQVVLGDDGFIYTLSIVEKKGTAENNNFESFFQTQPILERRDPETLRVLESGLLPSGAPNQAIGAGAGGYTNRLRILNGRGSGSLIIVSTTEKPFDNLSVTGSGLRYSEYSLDGIFDNVFPEDSINKGTLEPTNSFKIVDWDGSTRYADTFGLDAVYDRESKETFIVMAWSSGSGTGASEVNRSNLQAWSVPFGAKEGDERLLLGRSSSGASFTEISYYSACAIDIGDSLLAVAYQFRSDVPSTTSELYVTICNTGGKEQENVLLRSGTFSEATSLLSGLFVNWSPVNQWFNICAATADESQLALDFSDPVVPTIWYYSASRGDGLLSTYVASFGRILTKPLYFGKYDLFAMQFEDLQESDADSFQFISSIRSANQEATEVFPESGLGPFLGVDEETLRNSDIYKRLGTGRVGTIDPTNNPPAPLFYESKSGAVRAIFPTTTINQGRISVRWEVFEVEEKRGVSVRDGETLYTGSSVSVFDGTTSFPCGFFTPPAVFDGGTGSGAPGTEEVTQFFAAVATFIDENGRLFQSSPEVKQFTVFVERDDDGAVTSGQSRKFNVGLSAGMPNLVKVQYYATIPGDENSLLRLYDTQTLDRNPIVESTEVPVVDLDLSAPVLYTSGGVVNNDPPPSADFIVRTRDRIWVSGLSGDSSRIQASKFIRNGYGIEWSSLDQFFVDFPEEVVGMGVMDTQVIVLTRHGIYQTGGAGPDNLGIGFFNSPQTLPGRVGCKSKESIVTARDGVYFLSDRGIEKINRGFAAPTWDGETVRDTIEEYPICTGAAYLSTDDTIRWGFMKEDGSESVVIVKDLQYATWYVNQYEQNSTSRNMIAVQEDDDGTEHFLFGPFGGKVTEQYREDIKVESYDSNQFYSETGDIRVGGINGWGLGKKLHILGEYGGPTKLKVEMTFNKQEFGKWEKVWDLTDEEYSEGEQLEMRIALPIMRFSNCKFRLSWTCEPNRKSFIANGISLYYTANTTGGVRTQVRNQG